jgi:hypothetical protein
LVDDTQPEAESDLRRRAAWLLVMLAVVAVLFVIVISTVVGSDSGGGGNNAGPGPLDSAASTPTHGSSTPPHRPGHSASRTPTTHPRTTPTSGPPVGETHCPTQQTCILSGDIGNGVQAINAYRTQHGQPAVPGQVTPQAQTCAVNNGSGCSGGWAETELASPDGAQAVQKILQFGKLLDPHLKTIEVGWAYSPRAKLYYFAIVRND